jgi:hypothetical protein
MAIVAFNMAIVLIGIAAVGMFILTGTPSANLLTG